MESILIVPHHFIPQGGYKFSFLDLDSMTIFEKGASQYHKEFNYYPQGFDKICQSLETWLGNLRTKIMEYEANGFIIGYDVNLLTENVKRLIALQSVREPETLNSVMDEAWWEEALNVNEAFYARHGMLNENAKKTINFFRNIYSNRQTKRDFFYSDDIAQRQYLVFMEKLEKYKAAIVHISPNVSSSFILTPFHYTQINDSFHFVLTPRYAISLCPPKKYNDMFTDNGVVYDIKDSESVEFIYEYDINMANKASNKH